MASVSKKKKKPVQKPALTSKIPDMPLVHQWTHDGERVLLVKCVGPGGRSHNGFLWPKSGSVKPQNCAQDSTCETGGLFGWPWGVRLGGGKQIAGSEATEWIVFAAKSAQVFDCDNKAKVAAATPAEVDCEVVYYGTLVGALKFTEQGRSAYLAKWIETVQARSSGSSSATGDSGSSSATGDSGSSSATGDSGSSSATGDSGSSSATGYRGSSSATGDRGSSSATGYRGSSSATGYRGCAVLTGELGTIEVGSNAAGVVSANQWTWVVRPGAVVLCRWKDGEKWPHKTLVADETGLPDGSVVMVTCGEIAEVEKKP